MWTMKDMFYGEAEPVWILKPEKEDNKRGESKGAGDSQASRGGTKKQAEKVEEYSPRSTVPYYPYYYYPEYIPPPQPQPRTEEKSNNGGASRQQPQSQPQQQQQRRETTVQMKVPICCGECAESIEAALYRMHGVKSVECDTYRERVTVLATTAAPADILMECRKVFKRSRMWTDAD